MTSTVVLKFTVEGSSAITLNPYYFTDSTGVTGNHSKTHKSGWTLTGHIQEDYYYWVNDFTATHPIHGEVSGNYEKEITASSLFALTNFLQRFPPEYWDYHDI